MIIETVKVKGGSKGSRIINKSDFVDGVHELFDAPAIQIEEDEESEETPAVKRGRKAKG